MTALRRSGIAVLVSLAVLSGMLYAGGAIQWDREEPYVLQQSWGGHGSAPGRFNEPTGIAVTDAEVFVADARNARIQVFDRQGRFLRQFDKALQRPMNLEIHDGQLYVADFFADVIFVYDLNGGLQETVRAVGGLSNPGGVAVYPDGSLLVADSYAHRIVHLARDGQLLRVWGGKGQAAGEFFYPTDVAVTPDGGFYVADGYNDRVQQFDADGNFLRKWGGPFGMNIHGPFKGWFATVTSIAADPEGNLFTADFYHDRVQKFSEHGNYLTSFGTPSGSATHTAMALDVDRDGSTWVANYADHRVERWSAP